MVRAESASDRECQITVDIRGIITGSCLLIILLCGFVASASPDEPFSGQSSIQNQILIFSGAIPSGDGNVSIKAASGVMYQIPAMTPLGVIQTLAGTDMIGSYRIGDSLLLSRGIFTLDAVDSWEVTGTTGWFVQVNGVGLREYLLPAHEGLNTYPLKNGDTVIFAFGDPTLPVTSATAVIQVQIGEGKVIASQTGQLQPVITQQTPLPVSTLPAPLQTPVPAVVTVQPPEPVQTMIPAAVPVQTSSPAPSSAPADIITPAITVNSTISPTPVPVSVPEPQVIETIRPIVPEPVQNVSETAPPAPVPTPESTPVPAPTPEPTPETVVTAASTPEPSPEPEVTEAPEEPTPTPEPTKDPAAERVIYDGKIPLPSGKVNITANSGIEYEIPANSPLGVLNRLLTDGMINTLSITDRGMKKGGILVIDGIEDKFFTGSKTWFAQVNGLILQDYFNPETDGLNIYTLKKDDVLIFYYGDPAEPVQSAESVLQVRMT